MKRLAPALALAGLCWLPAVAARGESYDVPVTVEVTDAFGKALPGASVVLRSAAAAGVPIASATTDAAGVASLKARIAGPVEVVVEVSKDEHTTARDTLALVPAMRGQGARVELALRKRGETLLVITVVDHRRRPVSGVTVTVAHKGWIGTRDPDYRVITDGKGVATLVVRSGRYSGEQWFGTQLLIEASDQMDKSQPLMKTRLLETISYDLPRLARTIVMLPGGVAADSTSGIPVRIKVVDHEGQPVQGARVTLRSGSTSETREAWTGGDGLALLQATVIFATQVDVAASKPNYKSDRLRLQVDSKVRGTGTIIEAQLTLYTLRESEREAQIQVTVRNAEDGAGVADARVRLVPLADASAPSSSGVTAADGRVTLSSRNAGQHRLTVSQEYFEPHQSEVTLDRKNATLTIDLAERRKRDVVEISVAVQVTAADRRDAGGRPAPVQGAAVIVGTLSTPTDENGEATVRVPAELGAVIRVEAADYKPATTQVAGYRYVSAAPSELVRRVQLEPADPTEDSPFTMLVQVFDAADPQQPVANALVNVLLASGGQIGSFTTGPQGAVNFNVRREEAKQARQGMTLEVSAVGYAPSRTSVIASRLLPSREPVGYSVYLDDLVAAELAALASEVGKLEALKEDVRKLVNAADKEERKAAEASGGSQQDPLKGIRWQSNLVDYGTIESRVGQCLPLLKEIERVGIDGLRRSTEVTTLLDACKQWADTCSSVALAGQIELNFTQAIARTTELGELVPRQEKSWQLTLKELDDREQELRKEVARLEAAQKVVRAALDRARQLRENAGREQGALERGRERAQATLLGIGGRRGLKARHRASLHSLSARLEATGSPILLPAWEKRDWDKDITAQLAYAKQWAGEYGQGSCGEARTRLLQVLRELEDRWVALGFALLLNKDLPERAAACRKRALAALAKPAHSPPPPPPPSVGASAPPAADEVEVPDLSAVATYSIAGVLWSRGLRFGGVQAGGIPDQPELAFKYKSQDPPPGTKAPRGSAVTLVLWQGPIAKPAASTAATPTPTPFPTATPGRRRGVPAVVGKTLEQAMAALEAVGLRVGGITRGGKAPTPEMAGRIYHQSPGPGSPLPADGAVALKQYDYFERGGASQPVVPSGGFAGRWGARSNPGLQLSFGFKGIQWPGIVTVRDQAGSYAVDLGVADLGTMPARMQDAKLVFQGDLDWSAEMGWPRVPT